MRIVRSSIGSRVLAPAEEQRLKRNLFLAIVDEEAAHLKADPELIPAVRRLIEERISEAGVTEAEEPLPQEG